MDPITLALARKYTDMQLINHGPGTTSWNGILDKPEAFPSQINLVEGLQEALEEKSTYLGDYARKLSDTVDMYPSGVSVIHVRPGDLWLSYGTVVTFKSYSGGGGSMQMYIPYNDELGGKDILTRQWKYGTTDWTPFEKFNSGSSDGGEKWELINAKTMAVLGDQWYSSWLTGFANYQKVKFVLRSLTMHHQMSGTQAAAQIQLELPGNGMATYGYRFNLMNGALMTSPVNTSFRSTIPLLGTQIAATTVYPHYEVNGEIIVTRKDFGPGFLGKVIHLESLLRIRDPNSGTPNRMLEKQLLEFPMNVNQEYPADIGLSTNRPTGFTKGTIEVWGIPND